MWNSRYNPGMFEHYLVPANTTITAKGQGEAVEIGGAQHRVFLALLDITNHIEQEALDVTIFGSPDAVTWSAKPLLTFPQTFYRGETPMLLDLREQPDIQYLRAQWEASRWGRGTETPMFEFSVKITEVEPAILREITS
jgi:hypothetical protein